MLVPLNSFVDQSDKLRPKGKIVSEGLTSPLRNPMYDNFSNQIILDWRPSDNFPFPINYETKRFARINLGSTATPIVDNEGVAQYSPDFWATINTDDIGADLLNFNTNAGGQNYTIVGLCASKIKGLTHTGADDTKLGWRWQSTDGTYRYEFRLFYEYTDTKYATWFTEYSGGVYSNNYLGPPAPHLNDWQAADFQDKWVLTQVCRLPGTPTKWFARLLGGPYSTPNTPWETLHVPVAGEAVDAQEINKLYIPTGNEEIRLGFVTLAMYTGNNDHGDVGTEINAIDWTIYDSEHTTGDLAIYGDKIIFSCVGSIAFEIYSGNRWENTDGTTGDGNRVWYEDKTNVTIETSVFTNIRVVLKNSGLMNSESNAILTYLEIIKRTIDSQIEVYLNQYGYAAEMHIKMYTPLLNLNSNILSLEDDTSSLDGSKKNSIKNLTNRIKTTFNQIVTNYSQIRYLESSFVELTKYIKKTYGFSSMDDFLTDVQFKISPYCANVFKQLGEDISDSNITS